MRFFFSILLFSIAAIMLSAEDTERKVYETIEINENEIKELTLLKSGTVRTPQLFDDYCKDVEMRHKAVTGYYKIEANKILLPNKKNKEVYTQEDLITFYKYTAKAGDTLLLLAARCSIRQDTLATINHIATKDADLTGKTLILPTMDGLFIPEKAISPIEQLIQQEFQKDLENQAVVCYILSSERFYFIQNAKFSPTDRAFFLTDPDSIIMPLEVSRITSPFGNRTSPITGQWKMHTGIDLASPLGSKVFACKAGTVSQCIRLNPVFGNYIVLQHDSKMSSIYAHLADEMLVNKGSKVAKGQTIGYVGMSGQTTGPHLHFEIRMDGNAEDPAKYLPK